MIQLTLEDIRKVADSKTFRNGVKLHQKQAIQNISTYKNRVVGFVFDEEHFNTNESSIYLDTSTGTPSSFGCDCKPFALHGMCSHVVALLLEVLYTKEKLDMSYHTNLTSSLIDQFTSVLIPDESDDIKDLVTLLPVIHIGDDITLGLKIGDDYTYIIKDLSSFIEHRFDKKMNFGKHYIYNPETDTFSKTAQKILNIISEYLEIIKSLVGFTDDHLSQGQLKLPETYWIRLLKLLKHHPFQIRLDGEYYSQEHLLTQVDMPFEVKERNDIIHIQSPIKLIQLFKAQGYYVIDHQLYAVPKDLIPYINTVYDALSAHQNDIAIEKSFKHNFASSVLPVLNKIGSVSLGPTINKTLYEDSLLAEIYLDQFQNTVKGYVVFNYGDYKMHVPPKEDSNIPDHITIIQDLQKETKILNTLKASHAVFDTNEGYFTFRDEAFLYDFIYVSLPELQEMATIYYSDAFNDLHLSHAGGFSGKVTLATAGMLDFSFEIDGVSGEEIQHVIEAMMKKQRYYRLNTGQFLPLEQDQYKHMSQILDQLDLYEDAKNAQKISLPMNKAFALEQLLNKTGYKAFHRSRSFKQLLDDIKNPMDIEATIPEGLTGTLRSYQETGFKWLKALNQYGLGGILADDMGLGKTIQTIALLLTNDNKKPSIVVAPTSLIYNWAAEFVKFAPSLKYIIITGDKSKREQMIMHHLSDYDVIISSYGTVKRDIEHYADVQFEYCILDEAQHIKNHLSMNAMSVKLIQASTKLALTGTPIENNISELWSIFDFIMPGLLGDHKTFFGKYERPIIKDGNTSRLHQLTEQIKPFILRRLKKDVLLELPPKIETTMYSSLNHQQKALYLGILEQTKASLANSANRNKTMEIFAALTKLRQICCHPSLVDSESGATSSKLEMLNEIIHDALGSGHRMLIFSTFTSMLQIIRGMLNEQKIDYYYIDGKTKAEDRLKFANEFNDGHRSMCLISLKAGGTGLNLTGADMVIHYDPWWNLAAEDQATDRAYRIGQDKSVQVIKMLTTGTIEEKIFQLQSQKKSLVDAVIKPGETFINHLSEQELLKLFDDE